MTEKAQAEKHGPLNGVRILDMTTVQMGPYSTLILADLGADVIKVEPVAGDVLRQSTPSRSPKMGHSFLNSNRNKRSVALDLKHPDGRAALLKLAQRADALVFSIRPKAMERLQLGYEDFKAVNPQIIYVGGVGFGQRGRYSARPAYDDVVQGMAGIPWLSAHASGQAPRYTPNNIADRTSALHLALAIVSALYHRKCTGEGQRVDVPMFENLVHMLMGEHMEGTTFIPPLGPMGHIRSLSPERRPFQTKDGYLCTMVYNDTQWRSFFKMIGQPQKFEEPLFSTLHSRIKNVDAVYGFLSETLQDKTTKDWIELFIEHDLPIGPMNSLEDVLNDEHLADVDYFRTIDHPTEGKIRTTLYPTEFSQSPVTSRRHAPRLGEHTAEMLREAGYDQSQIDELVANGIAISPPGKR